VPVHRRMPAFDRDLIRGGHYGQRLCEPQLTGRTHGCADQPCDVHGTLETSVNRLPMSHIWSEPTRPLGRQAAPRHSQYVLRVRHRSRIFEQRPLGNALLYQSIRRLLNKRCVITWRELTLDVQQENAECQRLRPITSRP
jgi:hypothetical protein